ncbi:MAG: preprotein translocase subunit SecG [Candidatus Dasytiphilus stammeri]
MYEILLIIFLFISISLISLILMHQSKGMDTNSSSITGYSGTFFGSKGSVNFLTRVIILLATVFIIISIAIDNISSNKNSVQWKPISKNSIGSSHRINK